MKKKLFKKPRSKAIELNQKKKLKEILFMPDIFTNISLMKANDLHG